MPHNEGFLNRQTFGGESVCLNDHMPVMLNGVLKSDHANILVGSVLVIDENGTLDVIGASNTLPIIGVADESIEKGAAQTYVSYVVHGTVKAGMLKGTGGAIFSEYQKLQAVGVYPL